MNFCTSYLHHQEDSVEHDECHDEVLERRRLDDSPEPVSHAHSLLGHVPLERRRVDGKVDARFLQVYLLETCGLRERDCSLYLIFIDFGLFQLGFSLLLKCDDDQGHEDVDEEEGEDDEVDDVENGHLGAEQGDRRLVLESRGHRLLQHTEERRKRNCSSPFVRKMRNGMEEWFHQV